MHIHIFLSALTMLISLDHALPLSQIQFPFVCLLESSTNKVIMTYIVMELNKDKKQQKHTDTIYLHHNYKTIQSTDARKVKQ